MANDGELSMDINAYFAEVFPGEDREISRLRGTNYYVIDTLPGEEITNINEWYTGYLDKAVDMGFNAEMAVEVEPHESTEGRIDEAVLFMDLMTAPIHDIFDFTTPESRADIMLRYIDVNDTLDNINLDHLFANELNFTGVTFEQTNLQNASFVDAFLPLTNFNKADLKNANFSGADLRYADLTETDLTGADFMGADLTGASFDDSNWEEAVNLIDNPSFTSSTWQPVLEQEDAEDDEALEGDKNTCYAVTDLYDKNIDKYLAKNPGNFILVVGDNKECESLVNLKRQYYSKELRDMEGYYECSQSVIDWQNTAGHTKLAFNPEDYITDIEYVKVGSYNQYIVKPDWFYDGPAPDPRVFKLVSTGERKRLISKRIAKRYGTDVVSDVHCDPKDTFEIFRLEPVVPIKTIRRKSTKRKSTKRKSIKRKKTATTIKSRKVLHHRTRGRTLTAADETTAGGGRKKKRTLKKRTLKKRTLKKRTLKKRLKRN
jgi:hypothetical protein